jgi:hypothetical protein
MRLALVLLLASTAASADPKKQLADEPAKGVMRALKLAGVKPVQDKDKWTWKVAELFCQSKDKSDDKLAACECTVDKQKLVDASALAVQQALIAAGVAEKYGMGGNRVNAYDLSCEDDHGTKFQCSLSTEPK